MLRALYEARVTLKLKKCELFAENIRYLGHVIRYCRLELLEHATDAVGNLGHPTMQRELLSFLEQDNAFRQFVSNVTRLAAPQNKKFQTSQPRTSGFMDKNESAAFSSLKEALVSSPVLALPKT